MDHGRDDTEDFGRIVFLDLGDGGDKVESAGLTTLDSLLEV